jgi:hypothetical protein
VTTPTPAPDPVPAPRHGVAAWFEDHVIPGFREALADAEKARTLIPALQAWLPKLEALAAEVAPEVAAKLGPLVAELREILAAIEAA